MMSLIYEGHFYCFAPKTYLDRMDLTVIRPMIYVQEADVIGFQNKYGLPVVKNPCPADGYTKREYARDLVNQINRENPGAKERFFYSRRQQHGKGLGEASRQGRLTLPGTGTDMTGSGEKMKERAYIMKKSILKMRKKLRALMAETAPLLPGVFHRHRTDHFLPHQDRLRL